MRWTLVFTWTWMHYFIILRIAYYLTFIKCQMSNVNQPLKMLTHFKINEESVHVPVCEMADRADGDFV